MATTVHLRPSPFVQRATLIAALGLILLELALFALAARLLTAFTPEAASPRELAAFVAFGSVLTLQGMAVAALAWLVAAVGRTELLVDLDADDMGPAARMTLRHPWREWRGAPSEVAEAWRDRGWLHVRPRGQWRTWHVPIGQRQPDAVDRLKSLLPREAWLDTRAGRSRAARRTAPLLIAAAVAGALGLALAIRWLERIR